MKWYKHRAVKTSGSPDINLSFLPSLKYKGNANAVYDNHAIAQCDTIAVGARGKVYIMVSPSFCPAINVQPPTIREVSKSAKSRAEKRARKQKIAEMSDDNDQEAF